MFLNPSEILKQLELWEDMKAADFGSGSGGWVIPLAKILEDGKVYAIDILDEPLSALKAKMRLEKISNVIPLLANVEKGVSQIFEESLDLVLMTNLLFECEDKKAVLNEGKRLLKKGGRILVVDWKRDAPLAPKAGTINQEEVKALAQEFGLAVEKELDAGAYHFGLVLVK